MHLLSLPIARKGVWSSSDATTCLKEVVASIGCDEFLENEQASKAFNSGDGSFEYLEQRKRLSAPIYTDVETHSPWGQ